MASAEEIASGYLDSAGRWLKWTLDSEGTLTLDGQGATPNYSDTDRPPWFEYVDQVKRVEIKGSVTGLGSCLFKDHTALEEMPEIPEKLTWIGNYLFQDCTSLREVYYPWGDNNGGAWFADCTALEKVVFSGKATSIGIQSFDVCTALKEIEIPEKITKIGSAAFENCTALKGIDLPQNLAEIGTNAFYKSGLERVSFPESLKKIDTKAFADCQLRHVTLPIQATFGKNAFMNNPVAEIIIPEGVKALSQEMFAINVSSDAEGHVETIVLPSTLSEIPAAAFAGVKIDRMTIPGTVRDIGAQAFFSCGKAKVEEGVLTLGNYCFYGCKRLELPASVTTLGKNITCGVVFAPRGSAAYEYARYAINGAEAFWMVKNPKELMVRMPASVTAFGSRAIPTNFGTEVLYIPGSAYANKFGEGRWWDGVDTVYDVFYYEEEGSGDIREMYEITGFYGYEDMAVLPAKCNGKPINRLGLYCFNGIRHYNTIIVPEGIVESEESFTRNCADHIYLPRSLEKLELDPSWLSNTTFHVYKDSAAHKYLTERGGFKIRIIYDVDLRLPESLTSIAAEAFDANEQIQFVEIDEKVLSVGDRAFRNCVNLHYAYFLGMNTKIGKDVFAGCEELSIVCLEGSSAEAYAKANGIKYIRPDEME